MPTSGARGAGRIRRVAWLEHLVALLRRRVAEQSAAASGGRVGPRAGSTVPDGATHARRPTDPTDPPGTTDRTDLTGTTGPTDLTDRTDPTGTTAPSGHLPDTARAGPRPGAASVGLVPPPPRHGPESPVVAARPAPDVIARVPDFPAPTTTPPAGTSPGEDAPGLPRVTGARGAASVRIDLSDGRRITIRGTALLGRDPRPAAGEEVAQLITVRDPARSVSSTHLALVVEERGAWVVDRGSTNGTVVTLPDGQQVICVPSTRVRVRSGARVLLGDVSFVVALPG